MSAVDDYLAAADPASRAALAHVRDLVRELVPDAEEGLSYGMPALKHKGKGVAGFLVTQKGLSVFPHSGAVVAALRPRLQGFDLSKGTIRFSVERPVPDDVLREMVRLRLAEIEGGRLR